MRRKFKKDIFLENLEIFDIAEEGRGVARHEDLVIFVEKTVPLDVVDVKLTMKKKNYAEATPILFHKKSPYREEPFCTHFGTCGGCKWQNMSYERQLIYKQKHVTDCLTRIAKVALPEPEPILGSEIRKYYRNKLEFTFSNKRWLTTEQKRDEENQGSMLALGFHVPKKFDKIIDVETCHLQEDPSNAIRLTIKKFTEENDFTYFDIKQQVGLMRNLVIRIASTGEMMVIVQFYEDDETKRNLLMHFVKEQFPEITSLMYIINQKGNDSFHDQDIVLFHGVGYIEEAMEGLKFRIGPKSFYQTNSLQAYELYKITRDFAGLTGNEVVYDLYTGTGTIANFVAKKAKKVVGVEYVPTAIDDAQVNASINNITNTTFFAGDMKEVLTNAFVSKHGQPDVIITDPPRAGMDAAVIEVILNAAPQKIVYVSCNPSTQARDLVLLDAAYQVTKVRAVDMFPHTHHVESVVLLERR
ncbi:MAG: rRNA ((5))-methyltransferase RlmCD [Bacteroidota bacterium]